MIAEHLGRLRLLGSLRLLGNRTAVDLQAHVFRARAHEHHREDDDDDAEGGEHVPAAAPVTRRGHERGHDQRSDERRQAADAHGDGHGLTAMLVEPNADGRLHGDLAGHDLSGSQEHAEEDDVGNRVRAEEDHAQRADGHQAAAEGDGVARTDFSDELTDERSRDGGAQHEHRKAEAEHGGGQSDVLHHDRVHHLSGGQNEARRQKVQQTEDDDQRPTVVHFLLFHYPS